MPNRLQIPPTNFAAPAQKSPTFQLTIDISPQEPEEYAQPSPYINPHATAAPADALSPLMDYRDSFNILNFSPVSTAPASPSLTASSNPSSYTSPCITPSHMAFADIPAIHLPENLHPNMTDLQLDQVYASLQRIQFNSPVGSEFSDLASNNSRDPPAMPASSMFSQPAPSSFQQSFAFPPGGNSPQYTDNLSTTAYSPTLDIFGNLSLSPFPTPRISPEPGFYPVVAENTIQSPPQAIGQFGAQGGQFGAHQFIDAPLQFPQVPPPAESPWFYPPQQRTPVAEQPDPLLAALNPANPMEQLSIQQFHAMNLSGVRNRSGSTSPIDIPQASSHRYHPYRDGGFSSGSPSPHNSPSHSPAPSDMLSPPDTGVIRSQSLYVQATSGEAQIGRRTSEKAFVCPEALAGRCTHVKPFTRLHNLRVHMQVHVADRQREFRCTCGRGYFRKNELKRHQKTCDYVDKKEESV